MKLYEYKYPESGWFKHIIVFEGKDVHFGFTDDGILFPPFKIDYFWDEVEL